MKKVRITAIRQTVYPDLMAQYENPIEHTCDVKVGQQWISIDAKRPEGLCPSAWSSMREFVESLARGEGNFFDGWMKNPMSAMISCNDGFRPFSFYLEGLEEESTAVQPLDERHFTKHTLEVYTAFLRLINSHYLEHRDLGFYADQLGMTTTYLSRMVKQISGRTVADFINQALAEEAALRLRKSSQSISQLAKDLHFSDQAAFTKFFIRMKGMTPKAFRNSTKSPSSLT
jgi:uncharacterized repeat protein (TIGR04076 family)